MIENLLVFVISSHQFAIDLKYSPLVVKAIKVLKKEDEKFELIESKLRMEKPFSLVDLKLYLGFGETTISDTSRILIFESQDYSVGLLVDEVKYVVTLDESSTKLIDNDFGEEKIYRTYIMGEKKINIINLKEFGAKQIDNPAIKIIQESSINIGTIESIEEKVTSNDLVAMSVSIKVGESPIILAVDRKGKLKQIQN
jgi:purine-binding chemotaxis protein CheW